MNKNAGNTTETVHPGAHTHWGYTGDVSPEHWGDLCPDFSLCSTGKNQSPINLTTFIEAGLAPLRFECQAGGAEIVNNGHSVQVNCAAGNTLCVEDHSFELKQYHFHVPSENQINGVSYPMEAHLVYVDDVGTIAVIAVMYIVGAANADLEQAWARMPENSGDITACTSPIPVEGLLPVDRAYYRFNGSLTTPHAPKGSGGL